MDAAQGHADVTGSLALGFRTHVDLAKPLLLVPTRSDAMGGSTLKTPIPAGTTGLQSYIQFAWANTIAWGGAGTASSSHGLGVRIR